MKKETKFFKMGISPTLNIRGIIATHDIKENIIIERCPIILVEIKYENFLEKSRFSSYYFTWNKRFHSIVLGYGSIFNHSKNNNVMFIKDKKNKIMIFKTIKNIKRGEELTTDYYDGLEGQDEPEFTDYHKKQGKLGL